MASTIDTKTPLPTFINVFEVEPARQQELVDLLIEAVEKAISKVDGYVSTNIHKSLDGTKVTNYAQWRDEAAIERMLQDPEAQVYLKKIPEIAHLEPTLYKVVYCKHI